MTKSTSATMSQEEFQALKKQDPYGALNVIWNMAV